MIAAQIQARRGDFSLDATFDCPHRCLGVFGPSGSGKTTLLYALAGLVPARAGRIDVNRRAWLDTSRGVNLSVQDRGVGFVFQDARLFPHWNVRRNLLGSRRAAAGLPSGRLEEVAARFELENLLERNVRDLSGGEIKRVALGRALLSDPRLLILDEPLTGLDAPLRRNIMSYLISLRRTLDLPMVVVSHRYSELLTLTDWVVHLEKGRTRDEGPPDSLVGTLEESESLETTLTGRILEHEEGGSLVGCGELKLWAPRSRHAVGDTVHVTIRAEDCVLAPEEPPRTSARNAFPAVIEEAVDAPGRRLLHLQAGGNQFWAEITPRSEQELELRPGKTVYVLLKVRSLRTGD